MNIIRRHHFLGALLLLAGLALAARAAEEVSTPPKRADALTQARALLGPKDAPLTVKDPFHSEAFGEALANAAGRPVAATGPVQGPRSSRDVLQSIAASLKPSGYFVLSGEPTLVFGQKRVKAGGTLSIRFEGTDYILEIVSIERPNFTLRLNREEFTRPIK